MDRNLDSSLSVIDENNVYLVNTVDGDCGHESKRCLHPGRKAKTELDIKKQRYHFVNKIHLVRAMVFQVVMYGCETWAIKKAVC